MRALSSEQRRDRYLASLPQYAWLQEGTFVDADGVPVRAYDDVTLLQDIPIGGDLDGPYRIPAGTAATVLFFQAEPDGIAELECYWPETSVSFGFAPTKLLRFHVRANAADSEV